MLANYRQKFRLFNFVFLFFSTDYTKELFDMLYQVIGEYDEVQSDEDDVEVPPPLCSKANRPNKAEAVNQLYSRFQTPSNS